MAGRKVACFISLPNSLAYQFEIRPDDAGSVCLDKVLTYMQVPVPLTFMYVYRYAVLLQLLRRIILGYNTNKKAIDIG